MSKNDNYDFRYSFSLLIENKVFRTNDNFLKMNKRSFSKILSFLLNKNFYSSSFLQIKEYKAKLCV